MCIEMRVREAVGEQVAGLVIVKESVFEKFTRAGNALDITAAARRGEARRKAEGGKDEGRVHRQGSWIVFM